MTPKPFIRAIFWAVWFLLVPAALVAFTVWLLSPGDDPSSIGFIRFLQTIVENQPVPASIALFALFEAALWSQRHSLAFAAQAGIGGRCDIPLAARKRFERAQALLDEIGRIQRRNRKAIARSVSEERREKLEQRVATLRDEMDKDVFNLALFDAALDKVEDAVEATLSPWRKSDLRDLLESVAVAVAVALLLRAFVVEAFKIPSRSMVPTLAVGDHIFVNKSAYGPSLPFTETRLFERLPPGRGEVIVFKYPEQPEQDFIKRVVGIPGDRIEAIDGRPRINGWLVPRCLVGEFSYTEESEGEFGHHSGELFVEYLGEHAFPTFFDHSRMHRRQRTDCRLDMDCSPGQGCADGYCGELEGPFFVRENEAFVMGDNRMNSHDSRGWFEHRGGGVPFSHIRGSALWVWMSFSTGGSFAWDRIGVSVMGTPRLPDRYQAELGARMTECINNHPGVAAATPPVQ